MEAIHGADNDATQRLRELRKAAGLSQAKLADAIGMARETISQMERSGASIEKRTELAVRWATSGPGRPERTPFAITREVADRLDQVVVGGTAFDEQVRRLERLEHEWNERGGMGVARPLFSLTRGTLGTLRSATPGDPMQLTDQAGFVRLKHLWRGLAQGGTSEI